MIFILSDFWCKWLLIMITAVSYRYFDIDCFLTQVKSYESAFENVYSVLLSVLSRLPVSPKIKWPNHYHDGMIFFMKEGKLSVLIWRLSWGSKNRDVRSLPLRMRLCSASKTDIFIVKSVVNSKRSQSSDILRHVCIDWKTKKRNFKIPVCVKLCKNVFPERKI